MTDSDETGRVVIASWGERCILGLKGFCMGSADVVPGVSGGTMALILGIYQQLIEAVRSFDFTWLRSIARLDIAVALGRPHFGFLIPLVLGIVAALIFFTRIIPLPHLIETYPEPVYGLFFGLIVGSIIVLLRSFDRGMHNWLWLLAGTLAGLWIFNQVPAETPEAAWFVFISGALAISAMLLPGISGSFILLMLKKYAYIFGAIGQFNLAVLVPFAAGAVTGLVLFSRLLGWLLRRYHEATLAAIIGLLIASLWVIWPFQERVFETVAGEQKLISVTPILPDAWTSITLLTAILAVTGFIAVLLLFYFAPGEKTNERPSV